MNRYDDGDVQDGIDDADNSLDYYLHYLYYPLMLHHHSMLHLNYAEEHCPMDNDGNEDDGGGDDGEIHGCRMFDSHREIVEEI